MTCHNKSINVDYVSYKSVSQMYLPLSFLQFNIYQMKLPNIRYSNITKNRTVYLYLAPTHIQLYRIACFLLSFKMFISIKWRLNINGYSFTHKFYMQPILEYAAYRQMYVGPVKSGNHRLSVWSLGRTIPHSPGPIFKALCATLIWFHVHSPDTTSKASETCSCRTKQTTSVIRGHFLR